MPADFSQILATCLFVVAVAHTFLSKRFQIIAGRFPKGSVGENFFHLLGEVEIVFGLWAGVLIAVMATVLGGEMAIRYVESLNFTEPLFVFVIMTVAATRPVIYFTSLLISAISRGLPLPRNLGFFAAALIIGPLLGSVITEPAAMTVTALILKDRLFDRGASEKLKYATLGLLFVNVSIGGVLTNFAAPPVLMVASLWSWGTKHMLTHFGWKAVVAVTANTSLIAWWFRRELVGLLLETPPVGTGKIKLPAWLVVVHFFILSLVVLTAHHPIIFVGIFLFFIGVVTISQEYQTELKLKESLLVGFFLGGLVALGGLQRWWLEPILTSLSPGPLFLGTTLLTAIMDNAALTFLGAQVENISDVLKYALVSGAVVGGGLTVIANAPNPAGFAILRSSFGSSGIAPLTLLLNALFPTLIAAACFWFL